MLGLDGKEYMGLPTFRLNGDIGLLMFLRVGTTSPVGIRLEFGIGLFLDCIRFMTGTGIV